MTHNASHIIIQLARTVLNLEDRLEHLSDEQLEKVLEAAKQANHDLHKAVGD